MTVLPIMRCLFLLPLLGLTACGQSNPVANAIDPDGRAQAKAAKQQAADARAISAGFAPAAPAPIEMPRIDPRAIATPGAALPPSSDQYRYIGRWAPDAAQCGTNSWRFETRKLSTGGETSCSYPEVANVPGGYELTGVCKAGGGKVDQTIKLRFDERKRSMSVVSPSLGPVDLVYCGA